MTDTAIATPIDSKYLSGSYTLDPAHTRLGFVARHAMVTKVRGAFGDFAGTVQLDFEDPSRSRAELTIQVASVDTQQAQRDEHLRNSDFFDAPKFPVIAFRSSKAEVVGETYRLTGDLTIKDVTKPVAIDFEYSGAARDPYGNIRLGFDGSTVIKRSDWGLSWNAALETGGVLVSDKVTLEFDLAVVKDA